eukprot:2630-Heterococcus_DN1.PRE.1
MKIKRTPEEQRVYERDRKRQQRALFSDARKKKHRSTDAAAHATRKERMDEQQLQQLKEKNAESQRKSYAAKRLGAKSFCLARARRYAEGSSERAYFEQLAEDGFFTVRAQVPDSWIIKAGHLVAVEKGQSLFSHANKQRTLVYSAKRKMYNLSGDYKAEVKAWAQELLQQTLASIFEVVDPCVIHNNKVAAQPAHIDIKNGSNLWQQNFPLACIVALQDTSILVMRGSLQSDEGLLERVMLQKGDVFVMHGLTVHAGDTFESSNTRMHFVALPVGLTTRPVNETYILR